MLDIVLEIKREKNKSTYERYLLLLLLLCKAKRVGAWSGCAWGTVETLIISLG